jgi:hypothetical protein
MRAYKLLRVRTDGSLGPLFINARMRIEPGVWYAAEDHPTKGYAHRPGWHCGAAPAAPHLSETGRIWFEVEIEDFYPFMRPAHQGGQWLIAKYMRVISPVERRECNA